MNKIIMLILIICTLLIGSVTAPAVISNEKRIQPELMNESVFTVDLDKKEFRNQPPSEPIYISPAFGEQSVDVFPLILSWEPCTDEDGDEVYYDVYMSRSNPPFFMGSVGSNTQYSVDLPIDPSWINSDIYWKIVARDEHGAITSGPIWHFRTEGVPLEPRDPNPENGATDISVDFGSNIQFETGHEIPLDITFHIYFGTDSNPPLHTTVIWPFPLINDNYQTFAKNLGIDLDYDTTYYWKIVVEDIYGAKTKGPIWHFTTESDPEIYNLEGTVYYTGEETGTLCIDLFNENGIDFDEPIDSVRISEPYTFPIDYEFQVPNGEYYVLAYVDSDSDGEQPNFETDPVGIAVNQTEFYYEPEISCVISGNDVDDIDVTLHPFDYYFNKISGNIYYDGDEEHDIYVAAFPPEDIFEDDEEKIRDNKDEYPYVDILSEAGEYEIYVPDGEYIVFSWMDVDEDTEPTHPENGVFDFIEPMGVSINHTIVDAMFYENYDIVNIFDNDIENIHITLFESNTIHGQINYHGLAEGEIYIGVFDDYYDIDPIYGIKIDEFESSVYDFELPVYDGEYYIGAYMDTNNNTEYDEGEPIGFVQNKNIWEIPDLITVNGNDIFEIEITLSQCNPDLNDDNEIDYHDYICFCRTFGKKYYNYNYNPRADFDGDGIITFIDYQWWLDLYRTENR